MSVATPLPPGRFEKLFLNHSTHLKTETADDLRKAQREVADASQTAS